MVTTEHQILSLLALHPDGLSARELRSHIHPAVSQPSLWRRLDRLRAAGRVRTVGRGRATRYLAATSDHAISDLRSKLLHLEVGRKLVRRPELVTRARERVERMRRTTPYANSYLERWDELLAGPLEGVLKVLGSDDEESQAMRHVSPFAGILSERERREVLRQLGLTR